MTATAKKQRVVVLLLEKRIKALLEEITDLSLHERIDALRPLVAALQPLLDRTLDEIAEERRFKGKLTTNTPTGEPEIVGSIPVGFIRQRMDMRAGGCLLTAFIEATKET
jgi:hypothetical protein